MTLREDTRLIDQEFKVDHLPGIDTPKGKISLVTNLLDVLPEDKHHDYQHLECDNSSPGRKLAYKIALDAFADLPDDPTVLNDLAYSFMQLNDYPKVLACSKKQAEIVPDSGYAWANIAWCQVKLGKFGEALEPCEKALKLLPAAPNIRDTYAAVLEGLGRVDEAISALEGAMESLKAELPEVSFRLAMLYERKGDIEKAVLYWRKYLEVAGNRYGYRIVIPMALDNLSKYGIRIATPDFIKVNRISILTRMASAYQLCLRLFASLGEAPVDDARRSQVGKFAAAVCDSYGSIADELLSLLTDSSEKAILARHLNLCSAAQLLGGKPERVEETLKKSLSLAPGNSDAKQLLYSHYISRLSRGVDEAEEYDLIQSALELNPKPGYAHVLLARYYCGKGDLEGIGQVYAEVEEAEHGVGLTREREMLEEVKYGVRLWLAVARIMRREYREALRVLNELSRIMPEAYASRYWLTLVHLRMGNMDEAKETFRSIPPEALPGNVYQQMVSRLGSPVSAVEEELLDNIRSPRMSMVQTSGLGRSEPSTVAKDDLRELLSRLQRYRDSH